MIKLAKVESSQLFSFGHDAESNTLAIRFHPKKNSDEPGAVYHYANVTPEKFAEFQASESLGSYFINNIKKQPELYPYEKIDPALYADADDVKVDENGQP